MIRNIRSTGIEVLGSGVWRGWECVMDERAGGDGQEGGAGSVANNLAGVDKIKAVEERRVGTVENWLCT